MFPLFVDIKYIFQPVARLVSQLAERVSVFLGQRPFGGGAQVIQFAKHLRGAGRVIREMLIEQGYQVFCPAGFGGMGLLRLQLLGGIFTQQVVQAVVQPPHPRPLSPAGERGVEQAVDYQRGVDQLFEGAFRCGGFNLPHGRGGLHAEARCRKDGQLAEAFPVCIRVEFVIT